uniref:Transmembrane protein n=1 Tax=Oryza rufipogon TaxID=4529 RepID=A0A0E0MUV9_ORYRU
MLKHRPTPPPVEVYRLHRKLSDQKDQSPYLASDHDADGERREEDGKEDVAAVGPDFVIVVMVMVVMMMIRPINVYQRPKASPTVNPN